DRLPGLGASPAAASRVDVPGAGRGHIGSLRKMGRGTCRSTDITYRSDDGTHTVSRPRARPSTIAPATTSAVVDNGAGARPPALLVSTNPGRTTMTFTPVPA